jgi:hypothetical protein
MGMIDGMLGGWRVDHVMGEILDGSRQHSRVRGGRRAGKSHNYRCTGSHQAGASKFELTAPLAPGRLADQRQGAGRRARADEGSHCRRLSWQLAFTRRNCQPDELAGQNMHPRRGIGGEGPPVEDHVEQQVVLVPACPAGHRNPGHLA